MKLWHGLDMNAQKITNQADPTSAQDSATKKYVDDVSGQTLFAALSSTVSFNTTITALTGMNLTLPVGTWKWEQWVPIIPSGTFTNMVVTMSPTALGPPVCSTLTYTLEIMGATGDTDFRVEVHNGFNESSSSGAAIIQPQLVRAQGYAVVTTGGVLGMSLTATAGTTPSGIVQKGAYARAYKLA